MKTLALYSNKGGVGKTATTVNLSYLAAQSGYNTLVCDLDPQSSTTYYFRVKPKLKRRAKGLTKGGKPVDKSIKGTDYENLDLLPADFSHRKLDLVFNELKHSTRRLDRIVSSLLDEYDLVILDCPPAINLLAENIFNAADIILVPLIPTTLSERAHKQLISFFAKKHYDTTKIYAFISMVDGRKKLHRELTQSLRLGLQGMLQSAIPFSSEVEKMGIQREPVGAFAPRSKAAASFKQLWAEICQDLLNDNKRSARIMSS
jgi:chromosome partitioning protein